MKSSASILAVIVACVLVVALAHDGVRGSGGGPLFTTSAPARTTARPCTRTRGVVEIGISSTRYPAILALMDRAIAKGWPRVLTIERDGAGIRCDRLLRGIPTRPGEDRDEWPMAFARNSYRADVAHVPSGQNRGSGAVIGIKLRRFCDGQRFAVIGY